MTIKSNVIATLRLEVATPDGAIVDPGAEPLSYLHGGHGGLLPKLEAALDGKRIGDGVQVTLEPRDGFGVHDDALVTTVSLDDLDHPPEIGGTLAREFNGTTLEYRVIAIKDRTVVMDANHPLAGQTLVFSATVMDIRPATPEEIASEIAALGQAARERATTQRLLAQAQAAAEAEADAAIVAAAEAAGLVESTYLPQLGTRIRFVFRSETHKLCWLAPLFLLPAIAALLGLHGWKTACAFTVALWLAWCFLAPGIIGKAIKRWGYQFLFFDFSPNLNPSRLESTIVNGGAVLSVMAVVIFTAIALFHMEHLSDLLEIIGLDFAVLFAVGIPLVLVLPFLVMVLTAFRVRPVMDKAPKSP